MAENAIAVQEKPILFSGAMVRAVIEGRKTQTRRVAKLACELADKHKNVRMESGDGLFLLTREAMHSPRLRENFCFACPYGKQGDRLWVRHSFWLYESTGANPGNRHIWDEFTKAARWQTGEQTLDVTPDTKPYIRKPSIHMPRWASRLTLEIVSVKVERVQEISFQDCLAEGVIWTEHWDKVKGADIERYAAKHPKEWTVDESINQSWEDYTRLAFKGLWDSINEKRGFGWKANPWVWAIEFRVLAAGERRA